MEELAPALLTYRLTAGEYLEAERHSEVRHEYFDGCLTAKNGESEEHEAVAGNIAAKIHSHLKGKPCQVFKDGMKLRLKVQEKHLFYYPDIMVASW